MESLVERRTRHFYSWERRGRGWQRYPFPVALEPPFTWFRHWSEIAPRIDDGRHPSGLSRLLERWRPAPPAIEDPAASEEPEVEEHQYAPDIAELTLRFPHDGASPAVAQAWLRAISSLNAPASFELIGTGGGVSLLLSCRYDDAAHLLAQTEGFFPDVELLDEPDALAERWELADEGRFSVLEFGLEREFVVPLASLRTLAPDPLTSICAALGDAKHGELAMLQLLFQGAAAPWAASASRAVVTPSGEPFFEDAPEVTAHAREKLASPLFAVAMRAVARARSAERTWSLLRSVARAAGSATGGPNTLIPLGQEDPVELLGDVLGRTTHRSGMLLSLPELATIVHPPAATVPCIARGEERTKTPSAEADGAGVLLGYNTHRGLTREVRLGDESRVRHLHVIGAPGTGKSTLLVSLILQDIDAGHGVAVVDPHGDLVDEVLARVATDRWDDVVLFDPSDPEYVVGWNMLSAGSDAEKEMLASDFVAAFRRLSTSWGDQMSAVLANAVAAFLDADHGGTLLDLRRFLTDSRFRDGVLSSVRDPQAREFWRGHFPLLSGKPQASILTRLDTLLRGRLVRGVVTATERPFDFRRAVDDGRIILARLSQGAIGEENAALLGSLLVSRVHQVCLLRQDTPLGQRRPFFLYVDEFHHVATPSMAALFSGARKYRLGVTVAHQDLHQLHTASPDVERAILANAHTRICFRVGDEDARTLSRGLSFFTEDDLGNLETGQAICRIGRKESDFNLQTVEPEVLPGEEGARRRRQIREHSLARWGTRRDPDRGADAVALEQAAAAPRDAVGGRDAQPQAGAHPPIAPKAAATEIGRASTQRATGDATAMGAPSPAVEVRRAGKGGPEHTYLQELIKRWAEERGFRTAVEEQLPDGRESVDIALYRGDRRIACEITVTTPLEYEVSNVAKCLRAGFPDVIVVSLKRRRLEHLGKLLAAAIGADELRRVQMFTPEEFLAWLSGQMVEVKEGTVGGYRVRVKYGGAKDAQSQRIAEIVARSVRRLADEEG